MAKPDQFTAKEFINAMPGTGGIISAIAERVGCDWHTAKKYIEKYASIKKAYQDECETVTDMAVSVVVNNIKLAKRHTEVFRTPADSSDAKWWLSRKRKDEFTERQEITGKDGEELTIKVTLLDES